MHRQVVSKDDTRDKILKSARQIFSRYGYKKATVDEIARNARKVKGAVYYYFANKEEIFEAVVKMELAIMLEGLNKVIATSNDPSEQLIKYSNTRMNFLDRLDNFYETIHNDFLDFLAFVEEVRLEYDRAEIELIEKILNNGIHENYFNIDDIRLTSKAILTALKGFEIKYFDRNKIENIDLQIKELIRIIIQGLKSC